jgi:hypothetical protein
VKNLNFKICLLLAAAVAALFTTGCAHTEPENMSERPWNAPKSWEHGLPTGMMPR